jgi:hypothetical protein
MPYKWDLKNYWIPYTNNFCLLKGAPAAAVAEAAPVSKTGTVYLVTCNDAIEVGISNVILDDDRCRRIVSPSTAFLQVGS